MAPNANTANTEANKKKKKKPTAGQKKWKLIKEALKAKGVDRRKNFVDQAKVEIALPAFPEELITVNVKEGELEGCGGFNWTFSFFNKQLHGKNFVNQMETGEETGEDGAQPDNAAGANPGQNAADGHQAGNGGKKGKVKKRFNLKKEKVRLRRSRDLGKRQGYVLMAKCQPKLNQESQQIKEFRNWRLVAVVKSEFKGSSKKGTGIPKHHNFVFTKKRPELAVRFYAPIKLKEPSILVLRLWVIRIDNINILPPIDFKKKEDKICLRAGKENIFVHREALAIHSPIFRELLNQGLGSDENNPIKVEDRFTPSLVRVALRSVLCRNKIKCFNVVELLEFGHFYKIGALMGDLEESLINRRKCKHFGYIRKIDLAYKYDLNELKNTFVQKEDTIERIETNLKKKGLESEFKERLTKKKEMMEGIIEEEKKQKREKRKRQKEIGKNKKQKKLANKRAKKKAEKLCQNENTKKLNKLNIT